MPTLRERLWRVPAETRTGPEQVVLLVSAWEPHFLEGAMEGWAWGEHRLSEWTRANVTHVAFYRPYRAEGPAITHAAPLDRFYESRERGKWGYDLARQPEELPREIPRGEKWVQGPWLVTLESLLLARSVDDLEHPTRD